MVSLDGRRLVNEFENTSVKTGPAIEKLTRHLAECPESFLAEPIQANGSGDVHVAAVVSDLLDMLGGRTLTDEQLSGFKYSHPRRVQRERNRMRLILVACWLCSHPDVLAKTTASKVLEWLLKGQDDLAKLVPAESFVNDAERREELSRICLSANKLLPLGESAQEAENHQDALSTVKRDAVVREARAAEERARKLREEMARKENERRAATPYGHE